MVGRFGIVNMLAEARINQNDFYPDRAKEDRICQ